MKKIFLFLGISLLSFQATAQLTLDQKNEQLTNVVLLYSLMNIYLPTADFEVEKSSSGYITKIGFLSFYDQRRVTLAVNWRGGYPTRVSDETAYTLSLTWENDKLSHVEFKKPIFNDKGQITVLDQGIDYSNQNQIWTTITYDQQGRPSQVTTYNAPDRNQLLVQKRLTLTYQGDTTIYYEEEYQAGATNLIRAQHFTLIKLDEGRYREIQKTQSTSTYAFDSQGRLTYREVQGENSINRIIFRYSYFENGGNIETTEQWNGEVRTYKRVYIEETIPGDQPADKPYTWRKGTYGFNSEDEWISEEREDGKSRSKINGVWSDWKAPLRDY